MAQQIKKKFLSPEVIDYFDNQIISVDQKIDQEILDRQSAVSGLQDQIDNLDGDFATDAELASAVQALELADSNEALARENADNALDLRIAELEATKEVIEIDTLGDAPSIGLEGKLYVTKDENKLYRWATGSGGEPLTFDRIVGAGEAYATLEAALADAVNGENILVKAGTYLVSATVQVNKEVKIIGEDKDLVIFETAAATSAPVTMFNVTANNVAMAKLTIKHKKTSNTSVESAIVASGGGFPQTRIQNFILEQSLVEFVEFGVVVRAENWCVRDCTLAYATGSVSNSARAIGIYGNKGNSFIKDNILKNDIINGTSFRPLYLTSTTGSNPNETTEGKLVIEGTTHLGPLAQFYNQDNQQSAGPGTFELQIKNNIINESNLFAGFFASAANSGDMFSSVTLSGNTLSNLHAVDGGKGAFGVAGTAAFRSSPLVVHASNNTFGQEVYRTGWMAVEGTLVGKETAVPAFTVSLDANIPATGEVPSVVPAGSPSGYIEVSEQFDPSQLEADINSLQSQINTEKGRIDAILLASDADKDSFKEIVDLINSVDTENDQAFAGYVLSNDQRVADLESDLAQEVLDRETGDSNTLSSAQSYADGLNTAMDVRVLALEARGFADGSAIIGANLEYLDLDREYSILLSLANGRLALHRNVDYTVSVVGGVTRITWIGSIAHPDGAEKIETGDNIFWVGAF